MLPDSQYKNERNRIDVQLQPLTDTNDKKNQSQNGKTETENAILSRTNNAIPFRNPILKIVLNVFATNTIRFVYSYALYICIWHREPRYRTLFCAVQSTVGEVPSTAQLSALQRCSNIHGSR